MRSTLPRLALPLLLAITAGAPDLRAAEVPVSLTLDTAIEGDALQISGDATVPDGALMVYAAYSREDRQHRATGYAEVRDARYSARVDVAGWPAGGIAVDAHFQIMLPGREQPDAVVARYGPSGENMTGEQVVRGGGGFRAAVVSASVVRE